MGRYSSGFTLFCVSLLATHGALVFAQLPEVVDVQTDQGFLTANDEGSLQVAPKRHLLAANASIFKYVTDTAAGLNAGNMLLCVSRLDSLIGGTDWMKTKLGPYFAAATRNVVPGPRVLGGTNAAKTGNIFYALRLTAALLFCEACTDGERPNAKAIVGSATAAGGLLFVDNMWTIMDQSEEAGVLKSIVVAGEDTIKTAIKTATDATNKKLITTAATDDATATKNAAYNAVLDATLAALKTLETKTAEINTLAGAINAHVPVLNTVRTNSAFLFDIAETFASTLSKVLENLVAQRIGAPTSAVGPSHLFDITLPEANRADPYPIMGGFAVAAAMPVLPCTYSTGQNAPLLELGWRLAGGNQNAAAVQVALRLATAATDAADLLWANVPAAAKPDISKYIAGYDAAEITKLTAAGKKGRNAAASMQSPISPSSFLFSMAFLGLATYFAA